MATTDSCLIYDGTYTATQGGAKPPRCTDATPQHVLPPLATHELACATQWSFTTRAPRRGQAVESDCTRRTSLMMRCGIQRGSASQESHRSGFGIGVLTTECVKTRVVSGVRGVTLDHRIDHAPGPRGV